ncbi:hypothetical protein MKZ38_004246 [Zalerion maritima]|uniref:Heterokaryon incompatibility domain-containing protein n=1 Tax=Zalerion maritima TaxID=339359 RepID=A0AAD5RLV7_9PEZI|nr:hypothetical protein MKZ38_004246 [Zalerion maritima]
MEGAPLEAVGDHTVFKPFSTLKALGRSKSDSKKLSKARKEIRVVELFPKAFRKRTGRKLVSCYTKIVSLQEDNSQKLPFIALSYAPGDASKTVPIYVNNRTVQVPAELADVLQHFEHDRLALRVWADAVCINPVNVFEKDYLMGMTSEIFRRAEEVLVWLGKGGNGSDSSMRTLAEIGNEAVQARAEAWIKAEHNEDLWTYNMEEKHAEIREKWFPDGVSSFYRTTTQNILQRPWFRRVGSLQEAALNDNVHFVCGAKSIPKFVLWDAVTTITQVSNSMKAEKRMSMSQVSLLPETLPQADVVSHRTLDFVIQPSCDTMEELLMFTSSDIGSWSFEANDPRDRVFALLGIASDATSLNLSADYARSCREVYCEVAEAVLKQASSLTILYACGGQKNIKGLPSWVPDWTVPIPSLLGSRANGVFAASGRNSTPRIAFKAGVQGRSLLIALGYQLDTVMEVMGTRWDAKWDLDFSEGSPVIEFLDDINDFAAQYVIAYGTGAERFDAVWRTPIADSDAHFLELRNVDDQVLVPRSRASPRMKRSFEALTGGVAEAVWDPSWRRAASKPYVDVLKREAPGRRLFATSQGFFGLGQEDVEPGDKVCVLQGGDSPFLLRAQKDGATYQVIGESYVYGIMNGEFMRSDPESEVFALE